MKQYNTTINNNPVRAFEIGGDVYIPLSDACHVLGVKKTRNIHKHIPKVLLSHYTITHKGRKNKITLVKNYGVVWIQDFIKQEQMYELEDLMNVVDAVYISMEYKGVDGIKLQMANQIMESFLRKHQEGIEFETIAGKEIEVLTMLERSKEVAQEIGYAYKILGEQQ